MLFRGIEQLLDLARDSALAASVIVVSFLIVSMPSASAGNQGASVATTSSQPRQVTSILPTAEQAAAFQRGDVPLDTSLFEVMVFGFDDEPLFKMENISFDVQQREEPHFDVQRLLKPFFDAGISFEEREMPFEEGIRYYLMADGLDYQRNSVRAQFSHLFFKPLLQNRFHFVTHQNNATVAIALKDYVSDVYDQTKRSGAPFCMHLEDTAFRRDYHGADIEKPDASGRVLPQPCPACEDDRTRFAAIVIAVPPGNEMEQIETSVTECLLFRTMMLLGIRELMMADPSRALVRTDEGVDLTPDIKCVLSALYDPSISEGMTRAEAVQQAARISPPQCHTTN